MQLGKENWRTFERGIEKEWLLANGIGGYASSTVIGANTRRYHGLLVASLNPPVERHLILSKIDETIMIGNESYNLYSFRTPDYTMEGFKYQQRFINDPLPVFIYNVEDVFIEKKVTMVYGENTVAIVYRIINGSRGLKLRLTPLVNFRNYHHNSNKSHMIFKKSKIPRGVVINPYNLAGINITITCSEADFTLKDDCWFINMYYPAEQERGLYPLEDHFIPGYFDVEVGPDEEKRVTIVATLENEIKERDGLVLIKKEKERIKALLDTAGYKDDFAQKLTIAADKFIVYRKSTGSKTIIAGYPWFTDWGRDTMIALPGITLVTKRFDDARQILYTFSQYVKDGLLPNMFSDTGHSPAYNTVDASLWYFEAVSKYTDYTKDYLFIREHIYKTLKEIIHAYMNGTQFHIKMEKDFLISAGDLSTQLTWMDAKASGLAVTPRHGKAVEINALWYNALKVISALADRFGEDGACYNKIAEKVKANFEKSFWNEEGQCLYDVIGKDFKDSRVRPNQILAVSITNAVIEGEKAEKIVRRVLKELYTDFGIRSLSPKEDGYKGTYTGDQYNRDSAYHQGTSWAWLSGHFITAFVKVYGKRGLPAEKVRMFIEPFKDHMKDGCIGTISEIFDGDRPYFPRGCIAQAWSVGEVFRAYVEDILEGV
ncbi:MAG: glycogen debranching enzyme N-terminal domain-containing protein [Firmicutes bacterium]|nr:glycogen debranching enzyme N-terminal domain-containing protein [Bacillota bacterium]